MKVGDTEVVSIKGDAVAEAKVVEIDREGGTVTLIVPATKVVMGLRMEIDTAPPAPTEGGTGHVLLGVETNDGKTVDAEVTHVETTNAVESATAESAPDSSISRNEAVETPTGEATQTALEAPEKATE